MKTLLFICSACLLMALFNFPLGYYTFLRILVTIGAIAIIVYERKQGANAWVLGFILIAILFNPIIPVYLYKKSLWMPIDIFTGLLFMIKALSLKRYEKIG